MVVIIEEIPQDASAPGSPEEPASKPAQSGRHSEDVSEEADEWVKVEACDVVTPKGASGETSPEATPDAECLDPQVLAVSWSRLHAPNSCLSTK